MSAYLDGREEFAVVGQTAEIEALYALCTLRRPQVVLVDGDQISLDVIQALRQLMEKFPGIRLVVSYSDLGPQALAAAVRAGITALVPSSRGLSGLLRALRVQTPATPGTHDSGALTERELEIISLLGSGHSVLEMARLLDISPRTVENHKRRIYVKLGVGNQIHAVSRATSMGLTGPGGTPRDRPPTSLLPGSLVVVCGGPSSALEAVLGILARSDLPYLHVRHLGQEHWPYGEDAGSVPTVWAGPPEGIQVAVTVLVDPGPYDWLVAEDVAAPVVVSMTEPELSDVVDALLRGTRAIARTADVQEQLVPILSLVCLGYVAMPAGHLDDLAHWLGVRLSGRPGGVPELTARELDILGSIARGDTVRQTARALGIAVKTVENTQARLFRKLGVHNRAGALTIAYRLGLVDPEVVAAGPVAPAAVSAPSGGPASAPPGNSSSTPPGVPPGPSSTSPAVPQAGSS